VDGFSLGSQPAIHSHFVARFIHALGQEASAVLDGGEKAADELNTRVAGAFVHGLPKFVLKSPKILVFSAT